MTSAGDMNLGLESIKGFTGKMVQALLGFVGAIIFARILGPKSFGGYYFLLTLVMIFDRPLRGYAIAAKKRYSETGAPKREIVGSVLVVNAIAFASVLVLAVLAGGPLQDATNVPNAALVFVSLFVSIGTFYPFQKLLEAQGWISLETWNDTLRSVLTLVFQLAFVGAGYGAAGMGYGLATATVAVLPVSLYFLGVEPSWPSRGTLRSLWRYARYSALNAVVGKSYDRIDVLLLGTFLTTAAVGYYEVGYKLTVPAMFLVGITGAGLMSKVSNNVSRGRDVADDVTNATAYASVLSIPIFFGVLSLPNALIVTSFGAEYAEGASLLVGLGIYRLFQSQSGIHRQVLAGLDLPRIRLKVDTAALAVNVVCGLVLLTFYGAIGVVVGTVIAGIARYLLAVYFVHANVQDIDIVPRPLLDQLLAGGIMFGILELVSASYSIRSWIDLVLVVGSGATVYGLVLIVISSHLRLTIRSVWSDATS